MKMTITCKEATEFISKKEEGKLSLLQLVKLWMHFGICSFCKLFYRQNKIIIKNTQHLHEYSSATLTKDEKEKMITNIEQAN